MNDVENDLQKLFFVAKMRAKKEWYEARKFCLLLWFHHLEFSCQVFSVMVGCGG